METLATLRMRAMALRASIHNEHCLSAVELAGMNAKKTNEIIDVINELTTALENPIQYDAETETLKINFGGEQ